MLIKSRINRFAALLLSFLFAVVLLTGCADGKTKLSGRIAHIYGGTLLIAGDDGELYFAAIGDADTGGAKISPGQRAEMEYRGGLKETYPAEINNLEKISLTGEESNIVDVYFGITKEVIGERRPERIVYDFSGTDHLTESEQEAIGYIGWTELDIEPYYGTPEELQEQGIEFNPYGETILQFAIGEDGLLTVRMETSYETSSAYEAQIKVFQLSETEGEWTADLLEEEHEEGTE